MNPLIYKATTNVQNNTILNKGIFEVVGYAGPQVIMSNNRVEAREKAEKYAMFTSISFLTPLLMLPMWNQLFLRQQKVIKFGKEANIMQLSKKYLAENSSHMMKGIEELKDDLKTNQIAKALKNIRKKTKDENLKESIGKLSEEIKGGNAEEILREYGKNLKDENVKTSIGKLQEEVKGNKASKAIDNILKRFPDKEVLRNKLIKTNRNVLLADLFTTGLMLASLYWISNYITKKKTGQDGFSAEFKMADKEYVEKKAQEYVKNRKRNQITLLGLITASSIGISQAVKAGMTSKGTNKLGKFLKKHVSKFDYHKGIYMSRLPLALVTLFSDIPSTLLASRDKEELKYNILKNAAYFTIFFGGDLALNNVAAKVIDKTAGTKLVNRDNLTKDSSWFKKITAPINSFKEIEKKLAHDPKLLQKTKQAGVIMFWGNFALLSAGLGFALPIVLNKMVKNKVDNDLQKASSTVQTGICQNFANYKNSLKAAEI